MSSAHGATYYWDGNDTTSNADGGAGTWDNLSTFNWDTLQLGGSNSQWSNANKDTAVFGGTAGAVALGSDVDVGGLTFNTTGYGITTTGFSLNFAAANNTILFNNIAAATITGPVGGTGDLALETSNPAAAGTLTLNGASTGGWSGTTTINGGMTLSLSDLNQGLLNTSGITLNGGGITLTNTDGTQAALDRVNDGAGITSNGGTITFANTSGSNVYAETIGVVDLVRGQLNLVETTNQGSTGSQTLTLSGLTRTGSNTSAVTFSSASGLNTTKNMIVVTGETATAVGQIIGPWATVGTAANAQTDYAVYNASSQVVAANIAATTEDTWASGANVTLSGTTALTATRSLNTLRYTGGTGILDLGAADYNLETYGILNGGSNTLTISTTGTGGLTTPTGGGNLYLTTGNRNITISAPINDNSGAVTLVKSGSSTLTLSGTNTYSGGTVINAGTVAISSDANFGSASGGISINGSASLSYADGLVLNPSRNLTINQGGTLTLGANITLNGVLSGNGTLYLNSADDFKFFNSGNDFSGTIVAATAGSTTYGLRMTSIGDASGAGLINLGSGTSGGTFIWDGTAKTLVNRQFALSGTTAAGLILNNGSGALVVSKDMLVTGVGNKTLTLGGSNVGNNTFAGNITNGSDGGSSVITVAKVGSGNWAISGNMSQTGGLTVGGGTLTLSGTNTYSGTTNFTANGTMLVIAGMQALSANTNLVMNTNASSSASTLKLLDDTGGVNNSTVSATNTVTIQNNNSPGNAHTFIVGNNNAINGGTSSGTTLGSTIAIETLQWGSYAANTTAYGPIQIQGTDGYRMQFNNVVLHNAANLTSGTVGNTFFTPTTANVTLGNVTVGTGNTGQGYQTLVLDGTSSDNRITGAISNASDFGTSNRELRVTKSNTSTWTLSGTNTYTGATAINGGKLLFSGANALPTTGAVAVGANGHFSIADGVARNQTVSALTLTSLASMSFDWTGNNTGDQLTSTADITPTAGSRFAVNLNRLGTPGGSVTLLTGGAGSTLSSSFFYLTNLIDYTATLSTPTVDTLVVNNYTSQTPLTTFYWQGDKLGTGVAGIRNAWALSDGTVSNWSSTTTSYTATALTPGPTADVIFSNSQAGKTQQSTVLGADVTIKSLTIDDSSAVTIAGANGAALTLLSTSSDAGTVATPGSAISVTSNSNATSTISARVNLGSNQTWHVASGKTLNVSGIVGGDYSLTKDSAGTLTLSALPTYSGTTTIASGIMNFGGGASGGASITGNTSAIALNQGATLAISPSTTGLTNLYTVTSPITLSGGAGTANLRVGGNDVRVQFGNITGQTGVAQTLAISQGLTVTGSTGGGDRQNLNFAGAIGNGSGGTLGVSVNFAGASGATQNAFVNLSGQNSFTGDLTVTNTRGLSGGSGFTGAWLTIGGERYTSATNIGNGYLGGGNYAGNISISSGTGSTTLSYFSTADQILSGQITGSGHVRMDGSGKLTLSGSNDYSGSTTVSSGTLAVNGSLTATSIVTVSSGATLQGTGSINSSVTISGGGIMAPGASIESLATGALTMASGSVFAFEIADNTGTGADLLVVDGALSLTDVILSLDSASLLALASGSWNMGDRITLISYTGSDITSGFVGYTDETTYSFGSNEWKFDYNDTNIGLNYLGEQTGDKFVTLTAVTIIPEPGVALLAGLGALMLLLRRRRA